MLNNINNFFNLFRTKKIKKTLAPSDIVPVGVRDTSNRSDYQPAGIFFKDLQAQINSGGVGNLQQVTDLGNTTTNNINLINSAIVLDNGSLLQKGFIDNGADGGIARICSIGYQDEWENGVQYFVAQNSNQIVRANSINNTTPDANFDISMGYVPGSIFHDMNNQNKYICTDNTNGAAVWNLYYDAVKTDGVTITGDGTSGSPLVAAAGTPYKKYVALLTQNGTGDPTAIVLENTIGGTFTYQRQSPGSYKLTNINAFTINKTALFITGQGFGAGFGVVTTAILTGTPNEIFIATQSSVSGGVDDYLQKSTIEIRVYP